MFWFEPDFSRPPAPLCSVFFLSNWLRSLSILQGPEWHPLQRGPEWGLFIGADCSLPTAAPVKKTRKKKTVRMSITSDWIRALNGFSAARQNLEQEARKGGTLWENIIFSFLFWLLFILKACSGRDSPVYRLNARSWRWSSSRVLCGWEGRRKKIYNDTKVNNSLWLSASVGKFMPWLIMIPTCCGLNQGGNTTDTHTHTQALLFRDAKSMSRWKS